MFFPTGPTKVFMGGEYIGVTSWVEVDMTVIKDSGQRAQFDSGAVRDCSKGKGRYDLFQWDFYEQVAEVNEGGADKYGPRNYEQGIPLGRYADSAIRHWLKYLRGYRDEPHAAQAVWNIEKFWWTEREIREGRLPAALDDGGYLELVARRAAVPGGLPADQVVTWGDRGYPGEDDLEGGQQPLDENGLAAEYEDEDGADRDAGLEAHLTDFQRAVNYARQLLDLGPWNVGDYYRVMKINGFDAVVAWRARQALGTATWRSSRRDYRVSYLTQVPETATEVIR